MKPKIAIISFPWPSDGPYHFLSDLLKILDNLSSQIIIITGNIDRIETSSDKIFFKDIKVNMHYAKEIKPKAYSIFLWIIKIILVQLKESYKLIIFRKEIDIVIFYMAYPYYILPLLISKLLRKKTIEIVTRSKQKSLVSKLLNFVLDPILFNLLDGISPESISIVKELKLYKYKNKILPEGMRFIDMNQFSIKKPLEERENIVGFVGRITKEKGVLELIKSAALVHEDLKFVIIGTGQLENTLTEMILDNRLENKVEVIGWVQHKGLPDYLNQMKVLILPTKHSEGVPTIILEAMACGTPVLTTSKGGIKDIIVDKKTGFIINELTPLCISKNIIRVLNYPNLSKVTGNARELIKKKVSYESAVNRYEEILNFKFSGN